MEVSNFLKEFSDNEKRLSPEMKALISNASFRENLYTAIHSNFRKDFRCLLQDLLNEEIIYRAKEDDTEDNDGRYSENLYWCGLLLYKVGAADDVNILWKAKNINFDTFCAFDIQFLIGAGLDKTIEYLQSKADEDSKNVLQYIIECKDSGDFSYMKTWYEFREKYFRGE
jgi:hypothetical protein